jgi:hypothetical protein
METATRVAVRTRAGERCEYCRIHQRHYVLTFHVEHIVARQHGGSDDAANLALACHACNRSKGPNLAGLDPDTGHLTRLFHPRTDVWTTHFTLQVGRILGRTPVGRATVQVLNMNQPERVRTRLALEPELFGG